MQNIWKAIKKFLGIAEEEYEHIVSDFQRAIDRLNDLTDRKLAASEEAQQVIFDQAKIRDAAEDAAQKAQNTKTKLAALLG